MSNQPKLQKHKVTKGDYVGFGVTAIDRDDSDFTVWCEIREVTRVDGFRAFTVMFPDGTIRRTPILAKHVTRFKKGYPQDNCFCGLVITPEHEKCFECGAVWYPF